MGFVFVQVYVCGFVVVAYMIKAESLDATSSRRKEFHGRRE